MGFRVEGLRLRVWGFGVGDEGLGCRGWGSGFGVQGLGFGVEGGRPRVQGQVRESPALLAVHLSP